MNAKRPTRVCWPDGGIERSGGDLVHVAGAVGAGGLDDERCGLVRREVRVVHDLAADADPGLATRQVAADQVALLDRGPIGSVGDALGGGTRPGEDGNAESSSDEGPSPNTGKGPSSWTGLQLLPQLPQGPLQDARNVHLRYPDAVGDLTLRHRLEEAEVEHRALTLGQRGE